MKLLLSYSKLSLVILILLGAFHSAVCAQKKTRKVQPKTDQTIMRETDSIYVVTLKNESTLIGSFISQDDVNITLKVGENAITISRSEILKVKIVPKDNMNNGKYWYDNPHPTRYLFSPSAFNLKKGEGYYQNIYVVFNGVNYGLTDHITVGVGTELTTLLLGNSFILTPRIKVGNFNLGKKWTAGGGAYFLAGGSSLFDSQETVFGGITFVSLTHGTLDNNVTFSSGFAFGEGEFFQYPILNVSGMRRIGRNVALVTDNWGLVSPDGTGGVISGGVRLFGERMSFDIALFSFLGVFGDDFDFSRVLPYVDFAYKF